MRIGIEVSILLDRGAGWEHDVEIGRMQATQHKQEYTRLNQQNRGTEMSVNLLCGHAQTVGVAVRVLLHDAASPGLVSLVDALNIFEIRHPSVATTVVFRKY